MDPEESELRKALSEKLAAVEAQASTFKHLKSSPSSSSSDIDALKLDKTLLEEQLKAFNGGQSSASREAFRKSVTNTLERKLFYVPSFKIYGGVAGLYDYGPPGCAVKQNFLAFWPQHFVLQENMLEVDCPCVTPEVVLKASGHVEKFTDLMVKDDETGTCYRADHLLKDFCKDKLEKTSLYLLKK